jgi:hypothetical protein
LLLDPDELVAAEAREALADVGGASKQDWLRLLTHEREALRILALDELIPHLESELLFKLLGMNSVSTELVISKIINFIVSMEDPEPLVAEIVMGLPDDHPAYDRVIGAICDLELSATWLVSDSVLNAVFALTQELRKHLARVLLEHRHENAVNYYYNEIEGTEPPADLSGAGA